MLSRLEPDIFSSNFPMESFQWVIMLWDCCRSALFDCTFTHFWFIFRPVLVFVIDSWINSRAHGKMIFCILFYRRYTVNTHYFDDEMKTICPFMKIRCCERPCVSFAAWCSPMYCMWNINTLIRCVVRQRMCCLRFQWWDNWWPGWALNLPAGKTSPRYSNKVDNKTISSIFNHYAEAIGSIAVL